MDSRSDWFHGFKKKVLEGHRAMVPLGEDNEDAPYPSPRPITGLPEPIPGEPFWEKSYSGSASESGSDEEFVNKSESSVRSDKNEESNQTTPEPKNKLDTCQEPSFGSTEEEFISYIGELKSDLADLQMEVKDLNKYINNLHSDHDDCMNRLIILQDSVERSDEYQDFYRKLFESTKYKGGNGIIQPTKREKQVRYHHGKRVQDDEPLVVDPFVKALVDKRLEPITLPSPDEDKLRILDKGEVCKTEDWEKSCTVMDKVEGCIIEKTCNKRDKDEDNYTSKDILDNKNDDVGLSKIMDKLERNSTMSNISNTSTTTSSIETYNIMDGYSPCKIFTPEVTYVSKGNPYKATEEIKTVQENNGLSIGNTCTTSRGAHRHRERRPVLSASSSYDSVIAMDNIGSEKHQDVDVEHHCKPQTPPVNDSERILAEIKMIDYLIANKEEDASAFVGNYTIKNYLSSKESFSNSLGKYQKLPHIPSPGQPAAKQKPKPRKSSSDKSITSCDVSTKAMPLFTRSDTVNVPNLPLKEQRNQARLAKTFEQEIKITPEKINSTLPKIKSALPKIKPSSQNVNCAMTKTHSGNSALPKIKSENFALPQIKSRNSTLPQIRSGNSNLPKIQPFSGNNNSVLPKINSSSGNINSGNTNSTQPKIKSMPVKNYIKGNNKMAMKIKTPVLPNIMKSIPTVPKVYKPTPPTVKPTKRPYTGKYRKLPPILDLNAELEKQNTFKDA